MGFVIQSKGKDQPEQKLRFLPGAIGKTVGLSYKRPEGV